MLKKILFGVVSIIISSQTQAQLTVNTSLTAQQLVNTVLLGNGVTASNITFNGAPISIGKFISNGSNLGLNSGVVLVAGDATTMPGPNNTGNSTSIGSGFGDPDLDLLTTNATMDATVIEFDFVPSSDTVSFRYIFGSEEYNEYVCSNFNDVFGFFLSGPGINGPYSGNAVNIATLPGSAVPVSIGTVNSGSPGTNGDITQCVPNGLNNFQYFVDNANQNGGPLQIQLDGFTVPLRASYQVVCGNTYHIKIAVSDVFDSSFDSAVFLEAESFASGGLDVTTQTLSGDSIISEGCVGAGFVFSRVDTITSDTVNLVIGGNAIAGVDYAPIPTQVIFPIGEDSIIIPITVFQDGIFEGTDTLSATVSFVTECGNTIVRQGIIYIVDTVLISTAPDTFIVQCNTDSFFVTVAPTNGNPPYNYLWSTGDITDTIWFQAAQDTFVTVQITDFCGNTSGIDTVFVQFQLLPPLTGTITTGLFSDTIGCDNQFIFPSGNVTGGLAPYEFLWNNGDPTQFPFMLIDSSQFVWFQVKDQCNVIVRDSVRITLQTPPSPIVTLSILDTTISCPNLNGLTIGANVIYNGFYDYNWSNNEYGFSTNFVTPIAPATNASADYYISIQECGRTTFSDTITVTVVTPPPPIVSILGPDTAQCPGGTILLTAGIAGGNAPYNYNWSSNNGSVPVPSTGQTVNAIINANTQITLNLTDACHLSPTTVFTIITLATPPPIAITLLDTSVHCAGDTLTLVASVSGGAQPIKYIDWLNEAGVGQIEDSLTTVIVSSDTIYRVRVTDFCNNVKLDTIAVSLSIYPPVSVSASTDTTLCANDSAFFIGTVSGGDGNLVWGWWKNGELINANLSFADTFGSPDTSNYVLIASDGCGTAQTDTFKLIIKACEITVSNFMSPNGDGVNDNLVFPNAQFYEENTLVVYDRWGHKVFETKNYKNDWNGDKLNDGTYYWVLTPTTTPQGPFTGFVQLIRDK